MNELTQNQYILAILGALLVGLAKGGVPGVGNLTVLFYASAFGGKPSIGLLLPILIAADCIAIFLYKREVDWKQVRKLIPWMLPGLILAYLLMDKISSDNIKTIIGVTILLMTSLHIVQKLKNKQIEAPKTWHFQAFMGSLGGFATMTANAAGPVGQLYFASMRLPKLAFIGTAAWTFFIINQIKLPLYFQLGLINTNSLKTSITFIPFAILGALIAPKIVKRINQRIFERMIWFFIIVSAIKLLS